MDTKPKVVIVGAGPVGSLAALYAASRGYQVEVYDLRSSECLSRYLKSVLNRNSRPSSLDGIRHATKGFGQSRTLGTRTPCHQNLESIWSHGDGDGLHYSSVRSNDPWSLSVRATLGIITGIRCARQGKFVSI